MHLSTFPQGKQKSNLSSNGLKRTCPGGWEDRGHMLNKKITSGAAIFSLLLGSAYAIGDVGNFNFNETTGLINIPIARVAKAATIKFSAQMAAFNRAGNGAGGTTGRGINDIDDGLFSSDGSFRGIFGLGKGLEASYYVLNGSANPTDATYGFKWLAVEGTDEHPGFAVGVQSLNAGTRPSNPHPTHFNPASFFGVMSHSFALDDDGKAIDLHAGIGTGRLRNGFFGMEFHFNDQWSVMAEHDGTIQSVGLRIVPHERVEVMPVLQFQHNNQVHVGLNLSYTVGGFADTNVHKEKDAGKIQVSPVKDDDPDQMSPAKPSKPADPQESTLEEASKSVPASKPSSVEPVAKPIVEKTQPSQPSVSVQTQSPTTSSLIEAVNSNQSLATGNTDLRTVPTKSVPKKLDPNLEKDRSEWENLEQSRLENQ